MSKPMTPLVAPPPVGRPLRSALLLALVALAPSLAAAQTGVRLDSAAWRAMNVFLSAFVEAEILPFERGAVPHATLVQFAVMHHVFNSPERIGRVPGRPGYGRLRASDVAAAAATYFGVRPGRHRAPDGAWIEYADGYYVFPDGDRDGRSFAQVGRVVEVAGGDLVADVGIYWLLEWGADVYATPVEDLRRAGFEVSDHVTRRARVRRVGGGARERYVLLEYLEGP